MGICVLIPTYNEAKIIGPLVKEIKELGFDTVVIDDGSIDSTVSLAEEAGAVVLKTEINQGKGMSLRRGFAYVLKHSYDIIIIMDGDGQHAPSNIKNFIRELNNSHADLIIGNRMHKPKGMPLERWLTNNIMSFFVSFVCRQHIPDSQCGFRLIKKRVLEVIYLKSKNFQIDSEIIIQTHRKGFKIGSCPIDTIYTGSLSKINPIIDAFRFARFMLHKMLIERK
ncbi:MAG: glycosyltransferase family 2 protein [Candidatus Omnitrophota bacterium]